MLVPLTLLVLIRTADRRIALTSETLVVGRGRDREHCQAVLERQAREGLAPWASVRECHQKLWARAYGLRRRGACVAPGDIHVSLAALHLRLHRGRGVRHEEGVVIGCDTGRGRFTTPSARAGSPRTRWHRSRRRARSPLQPQAPSSWPDGTRTLSRRDPISIGPACGNVTRAGVGPRAGPGRRPRNFRPSRTARRRSAASAPPRQPRRWRRARRLLREGRTPSTRRCPSKR